MGGTEALIGIALTALSTVTQMRAADKEADAISAASNYNAEAAEQEAEYARQEALNQAKWAEYKAGVAKQDAEVEKRKEKRQAERLRSAAMTRKGITGQGTPSVLAGDIWDQFLLESSLIDYEADKKVWGFNEEARGYRSEADMALWGGKTQSTLYKMRGSSAKEAARVKKGSLLVSGASDAYGMYQKYGVRPSVSSAAAPATDNWAKMGPAWSSAR